MNLSVEEHIILEKIKRGLYNYKGENLLEGPARYFHNQALVACRNEFLGERHLEMVYATLASWGMNNRRANMPEYDDFKTSILKNKAILKKWHTNRIEQFNDETFNNLLQDLQMICFGEESIKGTTTKSKIVSASKILAHIIPDIVPPIDRRHTYSFFKKTIQDSNYWEKSLLISVMKVMYNLYKEEGVIDSVLEIIRRYNLEHICLPKLFDNVIITEVRKK